MNPLFPRWHGAPPGNVHIPHKQTNRAAGAPRALQTYWACANTICGLNGHHGATAMLARAGSFGKARRTDESPLHGMPPPHGPAPGQPLVTARTCRYACSACSASDSARVSGADVGPGDVDRDRRRVSVALIGRQRASCCRRPLLRIMGQLGARARVLHRPVHADHESIRGCPADPVIPAVPCARRRLSSRAVAAARKRQTAAAPPALASKLVTACVNKSGLPSH